MHLAFCAFLVTDVSACSLQTPSVHALWRRRPRLNPAQPLSSMSFRLISRFRQPTLASLHTCTASPKCQTRPIPSPLYLASFRLPLLHLALASVPRAALFASHTLSYTILTDAELVQEGAQAIFAHPVAHHRAVSALSRRSRCPSSSPSSPFLVPPVSLPSIQSFRRHGWPVFFPVAFKSFAFRRHAPRQALPLAATPGKPPVASSLLLTSARSSRLSICSVDGAMADSLACRAE